MGTGLKPLNHFRLKAVLVRQGTGVFKDTPPS